MASVANALLISPSAVSQQISLLEAEAGVELVERRGRGVALTPAGARLAEHAGRVVGILEEARTDLAELKRVVAGELRVAAFPSVAASLIPRTMMALQARYPALRTTFEELEPAEGLAALRAWQTDVAIVDDLTTTSVLASDGIVTVHLLDDALFVLMSATNPLSDRPFVTYADLRDERWALDTTSNDYSAVIVQSCREAGFEPVINGNCHGFEVVRALVAAGCSISVQPGLRVRDNAGGLCVKEIRPAVVRRISVAYRRGEMRNPGVKVLVDELRVGVGGAGVCATAPA